MIKLSRRKFLSVSSGSLGLLAMTGGRSHAAEPTKSIHSREAANASTVDIAVIGAGAFGGWTALYLREMGLSVALIDAYGPGNGHVFNLGHGITPAVPPEHVQQLIDTVHSYSRRYHEQPD